MVRLQVERRDVPALARLQAVEAQRDPRANGGLQATSTCRFSSGASPAWVRASDRTTGTPHWIDA